jgi:hypothetical protein
MKNIHVIPTVKPSRLYKNISEELSFTSIEFSQQIYGFSTNQHIYITNDEEIKDVRPHKGKWQLEKGEILNKFPNYLTDLSECKLVIMTTDQDLIKDGVQAIDDEFLEWFVKNPSCEEIEVERMFNEVQFTSREFIYKIIIPKEEPKQETLLQIANRKLMSNDWLNGAEFGAKWQQEQILYFVHWLMDNCELIKDKETDKNELWRYDSEDYSVDGLFEIFVKEQFKNK